jgi:hypothetical protein
MATYNGLQRVGTGSADCDLTVGHMSEPVSGYARTSTALTVGSVIQSGVEDFHVFILKIIG